MNEEGSHMSLKSRLRQAPMVETLQIDQHKNGSTVLAQGSAQGSSPERLAG